MEVDPSADPLAAIDNFLELDNRNNRMARLEIDETARGAAVQPTDQGAAVQQLPAQQPRREQPPAPGQQMIVRQPLAQQDGAQEVAPQEADIQQAPGAPVLEQRNAAQHVAAQLAPGQQGAAQQLPVHQPPLIQPPLPHLAAHQQPAAQQVLYAEQPGRQQRPGQGPDPVGVGAREQAPAGPGPAVIYNAPRALGGTFPGPQPGFMRGGPAPLGGYRGGPAANRDEAGGAVGQGAGNQAGGENRNHPYRRTRAGKIIRGKKMFRRFLWAMNEVVDEYFGPIYNNDGDDDNHHQNFNGAGAPRNQF